MEKKRHKKQEAFKKRNRPSARIIKKRLIKTCSVCGGKIKAIIYKTGQCRGGHYFGKIGIPSKREMNRVLKLGTKEEKLGGIIIDVLKEDPKPYKYLEHWECPKCYWRK